jgi:hypothetical protein
VIAGVVVLERVQALEHRRCENLEQLAVRDALARDEAGPLAHVEQPPGYLAGADQPQVASRAELVERSEGAHQRAIEREQVHEGDLDSAARGGAAPRRAPRSPIR